MKKSFFLTLFISSLCGHLLAQTITPEDKMLLENNREFFLLHDIPLNQYTFNNPELNLSLKTAANAERKRKNSLVAGGIVLGLGAIWTISGIASKSERPNSFGGELQDAFAGFVIGSGVAVAVASIPLFVRADHKKQQRDKAIRLSQKWQSER